MKSLKETYEEILEAKPKTVGTIMPTRKSVKSNRDYAKRDVEMKKRIAKKHGLKNIEVRDGEVSSRDGNELRIVGSNGRIRVFTIKNGDEYFSHYED